MTETFEGNPPLHEIRRKNIELLMRRYGSMERINAALGCRRDDIGIAPIKDPLLGNPAEYAKRIGDLVARQLEIILHLESGWLDKPHDNADGVHLQDFACNEVVEMYSRKLNRNTNPKLLVGGVVKIEKENSRCNGEIQSFFVGDKSCPLIPPGSLVSADISCRHFVKTGMYLLGTGEQFVFRKIEELPEGKLRVWSTPDAFEDVEDPSELDIAGRVVLMFEQKSFL